MPITDWLHYADHALDPIRRSSSGSYVAITDNDNAGTHFSDSGLTLSAAIDGVGVALASKPLIEAEVAAGRLVAPFDIIIRRPQAYFLVTPEAVADRPIVRAFRTWLLEEAAKVVDEPPDIPAERN
jgi:LysR family glycine cleavage system transcriptional activator